MKNEVVRYTLVGVMGKGFRVVFGEWTKAGEGEVILSHSSLTRRELALVQSRGEIPVYEYTGRSWYGIIPYQASYLYAYYRDVKKYNYQSYGFRIAAKLHKVSENVYEGALIYD